MTAEYPVILVLDGYFYLVCNLKVVNLGLPPHGTHKMLPLNLIFIGSLKCCYYQEFECLLHPNPGFTMSFYQVEKLFGNIHDSSNY
jgi:hypothetical protein